MTTVRIAHAEPRPGRLANGEFQTTGHLVVLADDAGHRDLPIWLLGADSHRFDPAALEPRVNVPGADELTARLLDGLALAFGVFLAGPGRIELRDAELTSAN